MSGFQVEMGREPIDSGSDWFKENIRLRIVSGICPKMGLDWNELNNNALRLSVEWSRIFPNPIFEIPARVVRDRKGSGTKSESIIGRFRYESTTP